MRRTSSRARDVLGVTIAFLLLFGLMILFMLGEHFLDNFKSH